jgi:transposase InsO family protein
MNVGMPPRSRNHLVPAACDTPTAAAASSLDKPLAISRQNSRSTSRRSEGFPGDFIGERPVKAFIQPAGLPINTSKIEVLRRAVESAQYTSREFADFCAENGVTRSMGRRATCFDNAVSESFFATYKKELIHTRPWNDLTEVRQHTFLWIEGYYNRRRRHSTLGYLTPLEYELGFRKLTDLAA